MTDMRRLMADAMMGSRDMLRDVVTDLSNENVLTEDEQLAQYEAMRGNPLALMQFTAQRVPPGGDVLAEAQKYEEAMEDLWTKKAGR